MAFILRCSLNYAIDFLIYLTNFPYGCDILQQNIVLPSFIFDWFYMVRDKREAMQFYMLHEFICIET